MALTNSQYDKIEREYSRRRVNDREQQQRRIREAFARIPVLETLEQEMADASFARAQAALAGNAEEAEKQGARGKKLREKKKELLTGAGYPENYLEMQYFCPFCLDTGYVGREPCSCRKRAVTDLLYHQSAMEENLERENFGTFSYEYYDRDRRNPETGMTDREIMKKNVEIAWDFIDNFEKSAQNLLLMGQAGTGKTFLSNCIAKELLDRCHSVIYLSSSQLFDALARQTFSREAGTEEIGEEYLLACELLIIDDLGTELTNAFVGSRLFTCINERFLRRKSTLISTNLGMNDMLKLYSERVTSRLVGNYRILQFPNRDIRILKRMKG